VDKTVSGDFVLPKSTGLINGFGGHDRLAHPTAFALDFAALEVSEFREAVEPTGILNVRWKPFICPKTIVITEERQCRWCPATIDLETLGSTELCATALASAFVDDVRAGAALMPIASQIGTPRDAFFRNGRLIVLTRSTRFDKSSFEFVLG
jgi:hypothetical protein